MFPDILGYEWEQGKMMLLKSGFVNIKVLHTKPPLKKDSSQNSCGSERVIRTKCLDSSSVGVVVCRT